MTTKYTVHSDEVRVLCIKHRYYTAGTNEDYGAMFDKCRQAETIADVVAIAEDIKEHSHTDETAEEIAEYIANFCAYASIEKDDAPDLNAVYIKKVMRTQSRLEQLAENIAHHNADFICSECLHTLETLLNIYEDLSNEEARAELADRLTAIMEQ